MSLAFSSSKWQARLTESPKDVKIEDDDTLILRSGENTDWWRTAGDSEPEQDVDRHSGPLYLFTVPDDQAQWTAGVWIAVDHVERFQQATLFIGQGDFQHARQPWLKCGVEVENEKQNIGSVVAAPTSDWTLFQVEKDRPIKTSRGNWLYVEARRTAGDVILSWSYGAPGDEKKEKHLMREVKGFAKHLNQPWNVGLMTCGPKSKETISTFHSFSFTTTTAPNHSFS